MLIIIAWTASENNGAEEQMIRVLFIFWMTIKLNNINGSYKISEMRILGR